MSDLGPGDGSADLTGGCLCGAIRFRVRDEAIVTTLCHCSLCRRAAGAPLVAWAMFPLAAFALERGALTIFASSPGVETGRLRVAEQPE